MDGRKAVEGTEEVGRVQNLEIGKAQHGGIRGTGKVRAAKGEGRRILVRERADRVVGGNAAVRRSIVPRVAVACMNEWNGEETERPEKVMSATCTDSMPPRL
jgi:hypothetical protein